MFQLHIYEYLYQLFAALSLVLSGTVVLSGIVSPKTVYPRKVFGHILFIISLCDFIGSIANVIGFPFPNTHACGIQGFLYLFFFPAAWLWTTALLYQLRCVMIFKKVWLPVKYFHLVIWIIAAMMAVLPLSTNSYGQDDYANGLYPCNLGGNRRDASIWAVTNLGALAALSFLLMIVMSLQIAVFYARQASPMPENVSALYKAIRWYPLGLLLTWLPLTVLYIINVCGIQPTKIPYETAPISVLSTQYGTILALIFFSYNPGARSRIYRLFIFPLGVFKPSSILSASLLSSSNGKSSCSINSVAPPESSLHNQRVGNRPNSETESATGVAITGEVDEGMEWMEEYPISDSVSSFNSAKSSFDHENQSERRVEQSRGSDGLAFIARSISGNLVGRSSFTGKDNLHDLNDAF